MYAIERGPAPGRGVLPQQRDPPLRRPRDRRAGAAGDRRRTAGTRRCALRDLLKFEFFFPDRDAFRAELAAELERLGPDWDDAPTTATAALRRAGFLIAHRVLRSFLDAQLVVAERLAARDPRTPVVEKEFLDECGGIGQQMLLQGRLHGPESLSRELFASALQAGRQPRPGRPGPRGAGRSGGRRSLDQMRDVVAPVVRIDEIDAAPRREVVGVEP